MGRKMADPNEHIPEPQRPKLTPLSAHPALAAASEYADKCAHAERQRFGTRAYYEALDECDAAWERIAAACGVTAAPAPDRAAPMVPSATTTVRMGGAVLVCSINDAACVEVPPARRCIGCPAMPRPVGVLEAPAPLVPHSPEAISQQSMYESPLPPAGVNGPLEGRHG